MILIGLGCFQLYRILEGSEASLWVRTMVPTFIFVVFSGLGFWLVNRVTVADFMISAESEMKKVSWSSRKEITVSTFIVISVVVIVAVLLGVTDLIFQMFFRWLLT